MKIKWKRRTTIENILKVCVRVSVCVLARRVCISVSFSPSHSPIQIHILHYHRFCIGGFLCPLHFERPLKIISRKKINWNIFTNWILEPTKKHVRRWKEIVQEYSVESNNNSKKDMWWKGNPPQTKRRLENGDRKKKMKKSGDLEKKVNNDKMKYLKHTQEVSELYECVCVCILRCCPSTNFFSFNKIHVSMSHSLSHS